MLLPQTVETHQSGTNGRVRFPTTFSRVKLVVVAGRRAEDDSLEFRDHRAPQPHRGLKALGPQLARVKPPAQLVGSPSVLLGDVVLRRLDEDEVAGAAEAVGEADVGFAFGGVERRS